MGKNADLYSTTMAGYTFSHVVPGFKPSQSQNLFLENNGSAPLALRLGAANPPSNPDNIDLSKVDIILTSHDPVTNQPGTPQSFPL